MAENAETVNIYCEIYDDLQIKAKAIDKSPPTLIAVSKTHGIEAIEEVIQSGCQIFGENRVQEAQQKWPELKQSHANIELHLIGPLQSNKTKQAVELFDCIQTIDREKIAKSVSKEMKEQGKLLKLFIQVNIGNEPQKAGIMPQETQGFVQYCTKELGLGVEGLMCIPPNGENPGPYFALLRKLAQESQVKGLSMGMSADYLTAMEFDATHVRVGSKIFGARDYT